MKNATYKKIPVTESVLPVLATLGVVTLSLAMPNILLAVPLAVKFYRGISKNDRSKYQTERQKIAKQALYYLKRNGYIKMEARGLGDYKISLTNKGKKKLSDLEFNRLRVSKPLKWDKKWWLVAGDIPTKTHRSGADLLRAKLKQMGFFSLQRTMWFYPYDPRKELDYILSEYKLKMYVTVLEVSRLDVSDKKVLEKHFKKLKIL